MTMISLRRPGIRSMVTATAILMIAVVSVVMASEAPHWIGAVETTDCTNPCHTGHHAAGEQLTFSATNVNLCQSCHASNNLPIDSAHQAQPGVSGTTHAFGVSTSNATYGAQPPLNQPMSLRTPDNQVVCSTCHNQHSAKPTNHGTPRISDAQKVFAAGGTGSMTSGGTFTGPDGVWYLVEVSSLSPRQLLYTINNGKDWLGPVAFNYDEAASLGDGVEVTVTSGVAVTERWEFYATYPFLRVPLDTGDNSSTEKFCRDCHRSWVMDHTVPLDGDGQPLTGGADADGNRSNDLRLDSSGNVQCISCHGVHYADSNTESVDGP
jgi:predicted CXXCH cytochrome family protein